VTIHFILTALALVLLSTSVQAQTTIRVPADYPAIQQAINASADGDTVLVAAGTYYKQICERPLRFERWRPTADRTTR
jgi:polygalacturonase